MDSGSKVCHSCVLLRAVVDLNSRISSLSAIKIALEELNALVVDGKPPIKKPVKRTDEPYDRTEYCLFAENPKDAFHKLYFYSFTLVKPPWVPSLVLLTLSY